MVRQDKTVIGAGIRIEGDIEADEGLSILGHINGKVQSAQDVVVDAGAEVTADVEAEALLVSGRLVGQVEAKNRVEITAEGRVTGDIRSPRILIADGAQYKGNIDMS